MNGFAFRVLATASATSLLWSAPEAAAAAKVQSVDYSPWAVLASTASPGSAQALCGSAALSAAGAAAQATPGCVLPAVDAPVPLPAAQATPVVPAATGLTTTSIGALPLLLGLAALGGLAALLLASDDGVDQINIIQPQPVSP